MNKYYNNEQYAMMKAAVKEVLEEKENEKQEPSEFNIFDYILFGLGGIMLVCTIICLVGVFIDSFWH